MFVKRALPFFLTFAVSLFIASFFVSVAAPGFRFNNRFRRHQEYHRMMEMENQRLKEENERLKALSQVKLDKFSGTFEMDESGNVKGIAKSEAALDTDSLDDLVPPPSAPPQIRRR